MNAQPVNRGDATQWLGVAGLAVVMCLSVSNTMRAQGVVSGNVLLQEPTTQAKHDVDQAIVYLEPVKHAARYDRVSDAPVIVAMREREYIPRVQIVRAGGTVEFPNQDPFSHNVFSNTALGAFDLGLYRRGATRGATFSRVGVYAVYCNIHASMVSFVVAVPNKLYARVANSGEFAIADVPAGAYLLHVWHERTKELIEPIDVTSTGTDRLTVTLDTRSFPNTAHLNKFGQPYAPTRADRY